MDPANPAITSKPKRKTTTSVLGSVFLGDAPHHHRVFTSTPPTSPSATGSNSDHGGSTSPQGIGIFARMQTSQQHQRQGEGTRHEGDVDEVDGVTMEGWTPSAVAIAPVSPPPPPTAITPSMSVELRLRWLEALLLGVKQETGSRDGMSTINGRVGTQKKKSNAEKEKEKERERQARKKTLSRRAEEVQRKLDAVVAGHEGLRKFMDRYDQYCEFLTPSFALSGTAISDDEHPPTLSSMSSSELDALLSEMEKDIRSADRDLREIDALEKRGVAGAGKLAEHEALKPRLEALVTAHEQDLLKERELENRISALLEKHATKTDALSELFVAWNDVITGAEDALSRAEREREEKKRLGYE